jgi:hypothetical protein
MNFAVNSYAPAVTAGKSQIRTFVGEGNTYCTTVGLFQIMYLNLRPCNFTEK